jgi:hypothetical protein
VFTARYELTPYIEQITFSLKVKRVCFRKLIVTNYLELKSDMRNILNKDQGLEMHVVK